MIKIHADYAKVSFLLRADPQKINVRHHLDMIMKYCLIVVLGLLKITQSHATKLLKTLKPSQKQQARGTCMCTSHIF